MTGTFQSDTGGTSIPLLSPEVTIQEMAKEIDVTPKTIEWQIAKIKGVEIERQGPANRGHWIFLNHKWSATVPEKGGCVK